MKQKTDYVFFGLTGLLIISALILSQLYGYILSINNYLAFIAWPIALFFRLKTYKPKRYPLGIILLLALFNIINFGIGTVSMKFGVNSSIAIETPGINPIILLIVIPYYVINKNRIKDILSDFFKGTEEERQKEFQKTVDFYLDKFNSCDEDELKGVLENFNDYPEEAKTALRQIQSDKRKNFKTLEPLSTLTEPINLKPIPGWTMDFDEVSNGAFRITIADAYGRKAEVIDSLTDQTIERVICDGFDIEKQVSKNWSLFLYELCAQKLGSSPITNKDYDDSAFGSWFIERQDKRLVYNGKDAWLIFQTKLKSDWTDIEIIKKEQLKYSNLVKQISRFTENTPYNS